MSNDEGPEDEMEMTQEQQGMLEQMLRAYAIDQYQKSVHMEGGTPAYFQQIIQEVAADYKNQGLIKRSVYDFSVDRFIFYRRHLEMDEKDAVREAYIDCFEYLIQLKNDFPMLRPPMKEDWRH